MRTVFISGASSDIGLALCRRYRDEGWKVVAHYRTPRDGLKALEGTMVEPWQADFSDLDGLERKISTDPEFFSRADAFVNLAAAMPACSHVAASAKSILAALAVNLVPGILIGRAVAGGMRARKWGRIVHASSIGVKFGGGTDSYLYSLSKHALEFIPGESRRWAADNVLVNCVRVGVTDTRGHANFPEKKLNARVAKIPMGRMATPDEIAGVLYWLGSDENRYVSSQVIEASGGE